MGKGRKTKREKMIADTRRQYLVTIGDVGISGQKENQFLATNTSVYSYVISDIKRSIITLAIIFLLNFILFFVLKYRIMSLPDLKI